MATSQYDGPFRHIHVAVSETDTGLSVTVMEFQIIKGRRQFVRRWPPLLMRTDDRPRSVRGLLARCAQELPNP